MPDSVMAQKGVLPTADWTGEARMVLSTLLSPRRGWLAKLCVAVGIGYCFGPIDLIPNDIPIIGYADQVAFVLSGFALAWLLARPAAAPALARLGPRIRHPGAQARAALLDGCAAVMAVPVLRLATGAWPTRTDATLFRRHFRPFTPLPPLMRALAAVPAGREQLTRAMLASWLLADEAYRGSLRAPLAEGDPRPGNPLTVWSGPPVAFLHLEKTAGMSVVSALSAQFHPLQMDADPRRAFPPHVFTPLPPFLVPQLRRRALVWGHYDLPSIRRLGPDRFVLTFLRDPAERILSLYWYWRSQASRDIGWNGMNQPVLLAQRLPLAEFLACGDPAIVNAVDNLYVRRLTGFYAFPGAPDPLAEDPEAALRLALEALESVDFVGITEESGASLAALGAVLGFAAPARAPRLNVTARPERQKESPEAEAALHRLTRLDRIIYQAGCARLRAASGTASAVDMAAPGHL